eukprot:492325_1
MGASTSTPPSTATRTAEYKNKQYILFRSGSKQMENMNNGVINTFNTTSVHTPLQCDPNRPHRILPIYFDHVSRFNNLPHKSDIELSKHTKKLDPINPDYSQRVIELSKKIKTLLISQDNNNQYVLTESHSDSNLPSKLGLDLSHDILENKLQMIVDSLNRTVVHQTNHAINGKKYEPLLLLSTMEFIHPLVCGSAWISPQKRQKKTMLLEKTVDDYGEPYWTPKEVTRIICGVTSGIKYKQNDLKPIHIPINSEVYFIRDKQTDPKYNKAMSYDESLIIFAGLKILVDVIRNLVWLNDDLIITPYNFDTSTEWGKYKMNEIDSWFNKLYPPLKTLSQMKVESLIRYWDNHAYFRLGKKAEFNTYRDKHYSKHIRELQQCNTVAELEEFENNIVFEEYYLRKNVLYNYRKIVYGAQDIEVILSKHNIHLEMIEKVQYKKRILMGCKFAFTGVFKADRRQWIDLLQELGASVSNKINNITHLIIGTHCVSNKKNMVDKNVLKWTKTELLEYLKNRVETH